MWALRSFERSEVLPFRRKNPETARTRYVNVTALIHLQAINSVLAQGLSHVEEQLAFSERRVRIYWIPKHNFLMVVPVPDIEELLVGRKCQAVGSGKIGAGQTHFA